MPLVATQLALFPRNKDLAGQHSAIMCKESEPKASGSKGSRPPYGGIANDSQ